MHITDIFGNNNVDNNIPFIIISGDNLRQILIQKDELKNNNNFTQETSYIYSININSVKDLFKAINLDINNFYPASDILLYDSEYYYKTLFINKNISAKPYDFVEIEIYNNGKIWQPIGEPAFKSIGLIYSKTKPKRNSIPMIHTSLLQQIKNAPFTGSFGLSEFKNLSNHSYGFYDLNIDQITQTTDKNNYFNLLSCDNRYITQVNDKIALYKKKGKNQTITYNINGELMVNGECLYYDSNNEIYLDKCLPNLKNNKKENIHVRGECLYSDNENYYINSCDINTNNKWDIINNKIISKKNNMCLSNINNKLVLQNCSNNQNQIFFKNPVKIDLYNSDFNWKHNEGRTFNLFQMKIHGTRSI